MVTESAAGRRKPIFAASCNRHRRPFPEQTPRQRQPHSGTAANNNDLRAFDPDTRHLPSPSWLTQQMPQAGAEEKRKKPMTSSSFPMVVSENDQLRSR
ncbi:hypothetical protein RLV_5045 [Rhizobium leguminosarum bv. viciae]|nr:hypothetical protein RLV_5045 [Rhizobium leguminosarum bv. viciae]